jgi:hypothetical protein
MPGKHPSVEGARVTNAGAKMLGGDPVPWLLGSDEPAARWVTLTAVLDRAPTDPDVPEARRRVVADDYSSRAGRATAGLGFSDGCRPTTARRSLPTCSTCSPTCAYGRVTSTGSRRCLTPCWRIRSPAAGSLSYGVMPGCSEPIWGSLLCDVRDCSTWHG